MIVAVQGVAIEMGGNEFTPAGQELDYHTSQTNPSCSKLTDAQFDQWFYLPGPFSSTPPAPTPPGGTVTSPLWGVDVSNDDFGGDVNYDLSLIAPFISALPGEGFSWVEAKCSQGGGPTAFIDPTYSTVAAACQANGVTYIPYHYADTSDPASQAQNCLAAIGGTPQPVMVDFEDVDANSNPLLNISDFWALVEALNGVGIYVALSYIPQWYWSAIGEPDLSQVPGLISSSFVSGSGYASNLYPGNGAAGWDSYGGATPVIYQFTDSADVANLTAIDADAYQGSLSDLQALLAGPTPTPTPTPAPAPETYTVQPGDTLSSIAQQFGVTLATLEAANPQITDPDLIYPGQVITIPTPTPSPNAANASTV